MSPDPHDLAVATSALRIEAEVWQAQHAELGALAVRIEALSSNRLEAGIFQIVVGAYQDLVRDVAARCREGAGETAQIASTLRAVAATYDAEERSGEHRFRNLY